MMTSILLSLSAFASAPSVDWKVTPTSDPSLRDVVRDLAKEGDRVVLAAGTYDQMDLGTLVVHDLEIVGSGNRESRLVGGPVPTLMYFGGGSSGITLRNLTLVGSGSRPVSVGEASEVTLDDVTVQDGSDTEAAGTGAGLWVGPGSTVVVENSLFWNNHADAAGGGILTNGTLTVRDTTFDGNSARRGGGVFCATGSVCVIQDSMFRDGAADRVGGLYLERATSGHVLRTTFCDNVANVSGPGLGDGAAIIFYMTPGTVTNSVFLDNDAVDVSGAFYAIESSVTVTNNTFVGNKGTTFGSAVYAWGDTAHVTLTNNLFTKNLSRQPKGTVVQNAGNASITGSHNLLFSNSPFDVFADSPGVSLVSTVFSDPALDQLPLPPDSRCDASVLPNPITPGGAHDSGDPTVSDPDGSRSDIGATGGPDAHRDRDSDGVLDGLTPDRDCDDLDATLAALSQGYIDADGDGYGDDSEPIEACALPKNAVAVGGDCDPDSPDVHPDAPELCDGSDNNCDDVVDEGCDDPVVPPRNGVGDVDDPAGCSCTTTPSIPSAWLAGWLGLSITARRRR